MKNSKVKKYVIVAIIGAIVTISLLYALGLFSGELTIDEMICTLADAFSATGLLMIGVFCLLLVSSKGMFDGIAYAGTVAFRAIVPGMRLRSYEKYGDYKLRKAENRQDAKKPFFILFVGLGYTFVGLVFTVIFYFI